MATVYKSLLVAFALADFAFVRDNVIESREMGKAIETDWSDCAEVEVVPGRCSGRPTIKGTRIEPAVILVDEGYGGTVEQTRASFPTVPVETIRRVRTFAH